MKFIHIADVHLGAAPDKGKPWEAQRSQEIWQTFGRVLEVVKREGADLLLIAGDLFHSQPLMRELKEVNYLFSQLEPAKVVFLAGNHDCCRPGSHYKTFSWAPNVFFFRENHWQCLYLEALGVEVYGCSYDSKEITRPMFTDLSVNSQSEAACRILLGHGGDEKHMPFSVRDLPVSDFDYIALGHIHKPGILAADQAAYAGVLEPLESKELGPHGYISGEINDAGTKIRFVPFASRSYRELCLTVDSEDTNWSVKEKLMQTIQELGARDIYRVTLQGRRSQDLEVQVGLLQECGNILYVQDETRPDYDLEQMAVKYRDTLIGDYIDYFSRQQNTSTRDKALYYGLQALLEAGEGREI